MAPDSNFPGVAVAFHSYSSTMATYQAPKLFAPMSGFTSVPLQPINTNFNPAPMKDSQQPSSSIKENKVSTIIISLIVSINYLFFRLGL